VVDSVEPVRAVLTFGVLAEDAERFEGEWRRVAAAAAGQPGCVGQSLCRYDDNGLRYVISSDWVDLAAFRAFERSPEQDALTAGLRRLRQSARMQIMVLVASESTAETGR
jgi:heme-degrading monooxygenase HmoA